MTFRFPPPRPWLARRHCRILSHGDFLPDRTVSNREIVERHGHKVADAIVRRTVGVASRHVADEGAADSDLLAEAARICLQRAGLGVEDLSKLVVTKFLGDRILPPTASILQRKLGSGLAVQCMDVDGGSNGFLQAFDMAAKCIAVGDGNILIASGGIINAVVSRTDPRLAFLHGDGAAAVLLGPAPEQHVLSSYFFSAPDFVDLHRGVVFHEIAALERGGAPDMERLRDLLRMGNWKDSLDFALLAAETTLGHLLDGCGLRMDEIDRFAVSEVNGPLWESVVDHLGIPRDKTVSLLASQGNTMSANLPLQLCAAERAAPSLPGRTTLFLSIGEGISGGGLVYRT
jgi:3-oxoacyl-[acyl-carrier-protein] synthase III